ncbi:DUF7311 family protein [Halomicrococcus gelatinilyticus]|uniref:DUF7311 family protein n=1 Tax=Halomicrococcus gelatinilyticus TaxID=1702103 RepID=UPI002E0DE3D6
MIVRTVLAVSLALALCTLAFPAVEDARTTRTERAVEGELGRLSRAMHAVTADDPVAVDERGARRSVTLVIPSASAAGARLEFVAVGGVPDRDRPPDVEEGPPADARRDARSVDAHGDVLAYRVAGGRTRVERVPFDVRVAAERKGDGWQVRSDDDPLVVRSPGRIRLLLRFVTYRGTPTVLVAEARR